MAAAHQAHHGFVVYHFRTRLSLLKRAGNRRLRSINPGITSMEQTAAMALLAKQCPSTGFSGQLSGSLLDLSPSLEDACALPEADVSRGEVVPALVTAAMIVVIDEVVNGP